jgi:Na+/H+ antiporter NhaD/arsenite permease-like protein
MNLVLLCIFVLGYIAIVFEQSLKINKAASALLTGILCWIIFVFYQPDLQNALKLLSFHFGEVSSILFFLLGAMTIVEVIDSHQGFAIISEKIKTRSKSKLLVIVALVTFFLSAILDNLTTALIMTSSMSKILEDKNDKMWFAGIIIIAANAGGVFSPIGDVTSTMLWLGGQITVKNLFLKTFLPSLVVTMVPLLFVVVKFKNQTFELSEINLLQKKRKEGKIILLLGLGLLLFVPLFREVTHLPPFMGMLFMLGILWVVVSLMHFQKSESHKMEFSVAHALQKTDTSGLLFFLGILLAVSVLDVSGILKNFSALLFNKLGNIYFIGSFLGLLSAVIDNVPLVAASQGMFDAASYPCDHSIWTFLALTSGTGGSILIIGSAAGIAVMGIENISFSWYLKNTSLLALIGFASGILVFFLQQLF